VDYKESTEHTRKTMHLKGRWNQIGAWAWIIRDPACWFFLLVQSRSNPSMHRSGRHYDGVYFAV